jgi:superfamily II DNA or RNA helicase
VIDKNNKLIIKADIAGAGKTSSFINYIKSYNKNALFICPWNSLCFNLKSKGLDAMTLDKVIGLRFNGHDFKEGKGLDINDYDKLEYIKDLMDKHSHIKFYATCDENQNKPIETLNINNCKAYYNNIISSMFF